MFKTTPLPALLALAFAFPSAPAQSSNLSTFTTIPASVAAGSLPETAPFVLGNANWPQRSTCSPCSRPARPACSAPTGSRARPSRCGPRLPLPGR